MNIAVLGTLDSKGHEHAFVADCIRACGHTPVLIDVGTGGSPVPQQASRLLPRGGITPTLKLDDALGTWANTSGLFGSVIELLRKEDRQEKTGWC